MAEPDEPPRLNRFSRYPYVIIPMPVQEVLAVLNLRRPSAANEGNGEPADEALEIL
jgi:hypothetical protein